MPTTTRLGIQIPLDTDQIRQGYDAMGGMATTIDDQFGTYSRTSKQFGLFNISAATAGFVSFPATGPTQWGASNADTSARTRTFMVALGARISVSGACALKVGFTIAGLWTATQIEIDNTASGRPGGMSVRSSFIIVLGPVDGTAYNTSYKVQPVYSATGTTVQASVDFGKIIVVPIPGNQ